MTASRIKATTAKAKKRQRAERSPAAKALRERISEYQRMVTTQEQMALLKFKEVAILQNTNSDLNLKINELNTQISQLNREVGDMRTEFRENEDKAVELEDAAWALLYKRFEKSS